MINGIRPITETAITSRMYFYYNYIISVKLDLIVYCDYLFTLTQIDKRAIKIKVH